MSFRHDARRFGLSAALGRAAWRLQYPILGYQKFVCLIRAPGRGATDAGMHSRELDIDELEPFLARPESNLRRKDLARARAGRHRCIGVFAGGELASFSLNATRAVDLNSRYEFDFPAGWIYHYMAVTLPKWRGRGLHAAQMEPIERCFRGPGFAGIVTLVLSANLASLASFRRAGFRRAGIFHLIASPRCPTLIAQSGNKFSLARRAWPSSAGFPFAGSR